MAAAPTNGHGSSHIKLQTQDAMFFMLTLACSANIGSALTYTGNPQNMIVAQDALSVMPSYLFTAYMLLPTAVAWLISKFVISSTHHKLAMMCYS